MSRHAAGRAAQRGCVYIGGSSPVLRRYSEVSLGKRGHPQTPAGQELYRRVSETPPEASHGGRHSLRYSRTHHCAGESFIEMQKKVVLRMQERTKCEMFLFRCVCLCLVCKRLQEHNVLF